MAYRDGFTGALTLTDEDKKTLKLANQLAISGGWQEWQVLWRDRNFDYKMFNEYIWRHAFAEALWGEKYVIGDNLADGNIAWKWHLLHMVLALDPIKYIAEHMPAYKINNRGRAVIQR